MTIALDPFGPTLDQLLIRDRCFPITATITEQPSAEMHDIVVVGGGRKNQASTFERIAATPAVEQLFAKVADELCDVRPSKIVMPELSKAGIERAAIKSAGKGACVDGKLGEIVIEIQLLDAFLVGCIFQEKINRCGTLLQLPIVEKGTRIDGHCDAKRGSGARVSWLALTGIRP